MSPHRSTSERPWIPPSGLVTSHLAHGASWMLLWLLAREHMLYGLRPVAWIHLVALSWLSLVALSVLLFVVPQFTELKWMGEIWARLGIVAFALGSFAMVVAFWTFQYEWLWIASSVTAGGLAVYIIAAIATLGAAVRRKGTDAAIARAFVAVFLFFFAAALIGVSMARRLATGAAFFTSGGMAFLTTATPSHASLAAIGWLTLLVMGVSARTIGPIAGHRSPRRWVHICSSTLVAIGALALGIAPWSSPALEVFGILACILGLVTYALDMLLLVLTATVRHRPPQAFVAASVMWLVTACMLSVAVAFGNPWPPGPTIVFIGLVGWIGQMVIAHLHHIGIRLIATMARGDDDETRPEALLQPALSWLTFLLFQAAIAAGCFALLSDNAQLLANAAISGALGWMVMTIDVSSAVIAARRYVATGL